MNRLKTNLHLTGLSIFAALFLSACASTTPARKTVSGKPEVQAANPTSDLLKRARAYYGKGDYVKSSNAAAQIDELKLRPVERTDYWNLRGLLKLAEKNPQAAIPDFHRAIEENMRPEFAGYYEYNLASALHDSGKSEEALNRLNTIRVEQLDPMDQKKVATLKEKIEKIKSNPGIADSSGLALSTASPTATPARYDGPVRPLRIGLLLPLSGKYETFGKKAQKAIELAFQTSTDSRAKSYELIPIDSGQSINAHELALKKLVEEEQVIAVIGPLLSNPLDALTLRAAYYQIPIISIAQGSAPISPDLFSCAISLKDQAEKIAEHAIKTRGFKRFAILAPSNKAGTEIANLFWDQVEALRGEVKAFELYDPEIRDFREPVDKTLGLFYTETRREELAELAKKREELKITRKTMKTIQYFSLPPIVDFDAVFIADEAKTVGQIIPTFAYRDAKNLAYLGISSWNSTQLVSRAGDQAEGASFPVGFNTINPPEETKRFFELYSNTYDASPGELDAIAFDAAALVIKTLSSEPDNRAEFIEKLENVGSTVGATGIVKMKEHRCTRNLPIYMVKRGQFQLVD